MNIQLNSIEQAPRQLPIWPQLMDNLCQPSAVRVAHVLGVSERTVRRYNVTGDAPRAALLAMFWLTTWGRSQINAQAVNDAQLAVSHMQSLQRKIGRLENEVRHLRAIGNFGAANDPLRRPMKPGATDALPL